MRYFVLALALAGCTDDPTEALGSGSLRSAQWGGGLCQAGYACAGSLLLGPSGFIARDASGATVARGALTSTATADLAAQVAAIPVDQPTGLLAYREGIEDSGTVSLEIHRTNEIRIYLTSGFQGDLALYVGGLRDSINTCTTDTRIASYDSCTQPQ